MVIARHERAVVFAVGAALYGLCELVYRGYTHPSMLLLGGVCLERIYDAEKRFNVLPLYLRCLSGGTFITSLELVTGSIVNIALKWNVWDYSDKPFCFLGQICPQYFLLWVLLTFPALHICTFVRELYGRLYA